jgi:hypothetical protein
MTMTRSLFVPFGAEWRYLHVDGTPPAGWNDPVFDDAAWDIGTAPIGYSTKEPGTRIYPGPSFKLRPAAAQLRHTFTVNDPGALAQTRFTLGVHRNVGVRVYLNGDLVAWDGVPWPYFADDLTTGAFTSGDTSRFPLQFTIGPRSMRPGRNVLAVDLRHAQRAYGAMTFDLSFASGEAPLDRSEFADASARPNIEPIPVGAFAPDFEWLEVLTKKTRRLSEFAGRPFLLQFTGAECRPCWKKLPIIRRWAGAGLTCMSISSWGTIDDMAEPAARHAALLEGILVGAEPNAYDAYQTACYRKFGIFNGSILVGADGHVLSVATGFTLEEYLGEARILDGILRGLGYEFGPIPEHINVIGGTDDWRVTSQSKTGLAEVGASMAPATR